MKVIFTTNFDDKFNNVNAIQNAMRDIGYMGLKSIQDKTPVRSGNLRNSETYTVSRDRITWGATAAYADIINDRYEFMEEGIEEIKDDIANLLVNAFKENIK